MLARQSTQFFIFITAVVVTIFTTIEIGIYTSVRASIILLLVRIAWPKGTFPGHVALHDKSINVSRNVFTPGAQGPPSDASITSAAPLCWLHRVAGVLHPALQSPDMCPTLQTRALRPTDAPLPISMCRHYPNVPHAVLRRLGHHLHASPPSPCPRQRRTASLPTRSDWTHVLHPHRGRVSLHAHSPSLRSHCPRTGLVPYCAGFIHITLALVRLDPCLRSGSR